MLYCSLFGHKQHSFIFLMKSTFDKNAKKKKEKVDKNERDAGRVQQQYRG